MSRLLLSLALIAVAACTPDAPAPPVVCLGHAALCDRPFDEVALAGSHNAMSSEADGFVIPNQTAAIPEQLALGVRAFLIDTYSTEEGLFLCHGSCLLGSTPLSETLRELKSFLDENPGEIVSLLVQDATTPAEFAGAMEGAGLAGAVLTHARGTAWPTIGQMIEDGTRVVVFAEQQGPPPAWYHHMFDLVQDTPFTFERVEDMTCELLRGEPDHELLLVNHWLQAPSSSRELAAIANDAVVLQERVQRCAVERGQMPNVVAVDHVDVGDLVLVVDALNGL